MLASRTTSTDLLQTDLLGNPVDPRLGYARGSILKSSLEERISAMRVMSRVRKKMDNGETVHNLTGVFRYAFTTSGSLERPPSRSIADQTEDTQEEVLKWFGGSSEEHSALIGVRLTSLNIAIILTLTKKKHTVLHIAARDEENATSDVHPSEVYGARLANANLVQIKGIRDLDKINKSDIGLIIVTPFVDSKLHLPLEDLKQVIQFGNSEDIIVYVDDSHSSLRVNGLGEPKALELGADLAGDSTDKHIRGPLGGMMAGRRNLVEDISLTSSSLGAVAQPHCDYDLATGVLRALKAYDAAEIKRFYEFGQELYAKFKKRWGDIVWNAYGGVGLSMEGVAEIASENTSAKALGLVPSEIATVFGAKLVEQENILAFGAINLPGEKRSPRIMGFPDGLKLGTDAVESSIERAFDATGKTLNDQEAVKRLILES